MSACPISDHRARVIPSMGRSLERQLLMVILSIQVANSDFEYGQSLECQLLMVILSMGRSLEHQLLMVILSIGRLLTMILSMGNLLSVSC